MIGYREKSLKLYFPRRLAKVNSRNEFITIAPLYRELEYNIGHTKINRFQFFVVVLICHWNKTYTQHTHSVAGGFSEISVDWQNNENQRTDCYCCIFDSFFGRKSFDFQSCQRICVWPKNVLTCGPTFTFVLIDINQ